MKSDFGITGSIPSRLRFLGLVMALSGITSLVAYTLHFSPLFMIAASAVMVMSGYAVVGLAGRIKHLTGQSSNAIGSFIRGSYDARAVPSENEDEFARLQYRINHLFDILDLSLRGGEARVDFDDEVVYIERLRQSALYQALADQRGYDYQPPKLGSTQQQFSQIAHEADELQLATAHVQLLVRELVEKAEQPGGNASPWVEDFNSTIRQVATQAADVSHIIGEAVGFAERSYESLQNLRSVSDQVSETLERVDSLSSQSSLLILNAKIAASRGEDRYNDVATGVKALAEETRSASICVTASIDEIRSVAAEAVRMVYEMLGRLRQVGEATAGLQWSAERQNSAPLKEPKGPVFIGEAQETLLAVGRLRERAVKLNAEVRQLSDAA